MKKISIILASLAAVAVLTITTSCNDEWKEEQYAHYISFKAPLDANGVSPVYVPFTRKAEDGSPLYSSDANGGLGVTDYLLPVLVSGTTNSDANLTVHIGISDTLNILNYERFQHSEEIYYKNLADYKNASGQDFCTYPETIEIKEGESKALLKLKFDLNGLDLAEKWILPLTIVDNNGAYGYLAHPRKHYAKALLRIYPFNKYSGEYSATTQQMALEGTTVNPGGLTSRAYVVDENTVFFYAGNNIDELRNDRHLYKVFAHFVPTETNPNAGEVHLSAENPLMNFTTDTSKPAQFLISEQQDDVQPYLVHRYLTISGIDYKFDDYTAIEGKPRTYRVSGSLTMERQVNTQIPDEDQAIQW